VTATEETLAATPRGSIDLGTGRRTAVIALARAEGRRLARHPMVLAGVVFALAAFVVATRGSAPVLQRDDILTGLSLLPVAAGTFLAANLAALRGRRHGTDELYDSLVLSPADRTEGLLLALLWPAAVSVLLVAAEIAYLLFQQSVGSPSPLELLVGPAIVLLGGTLGIALARWMPSLVAGPVGLVALVSIQAYLLFRLPGGTLHQPQNRWLAPWVPMAVSGYPPRELVVRPAGWHIGYLVALVLLVSAVALLRFRPAAGPALAAALCLALVLAAASVQLRAPTSGQSAALEDLLLRPERHQTCLVRDNIRYCAYPAYVPWIDRWAVPVEAVLRNVPIASRPAIEIVQTYQDIWAADLPKAWLKRIGEGDVTYPAEVVGQIHPDARWGTGPALGESELSLALPVATRAVGLPTSPTEVRLTTRDIDRLIADMGPPPSKQDRAGFVHDLESQPYWCSPQGQSRAVVALWFAAEATSATRSAYAALLRSDPYGAAGLVIDGHGMTSYTGTDEYALSDLTFVTASNSPALQWPRQEAYYALELLQQPGAHVAGLITANWARLTDPATPTSVLAEMFGLKPLPSLDEQLRRAGIDPARWHADQPDSYQVPCR
jgi:hypothetical protein